MTKKTILSLCLRCAGWLALLSVIVGGVLIRVGSEKSAEAARAKELPKEVFFGPVAVRGPGDNAHVKIKQFSLGHAYVYECDRDENWTQVWIPMFPAGALPAQHPVQVILRSVNVRNGSDIEALARKPYLTGIMAKSGKIISSKSQANLSLDYSGINFDKVHIFEEGLQAPSIEEARSIFYGGIGLCIFGVLCGIAWFFNLGNG